MGFIYKITNLVNNKIYIGQTTSTIEKRFQEHILEAKADRATSILLNRAICKYGEENFKVEKIEFCGNKELNEREKFWIKKLDSHYSLGNGYNISWGGQGRVLYSDDDILKLWNQGYKASEISNILQANCNTISQRLKVLKPNEARARHIDSRKTPVLQYDLSGNFIKRFDSISDAARYYDTDTGAITNCCNKKHCTCINTLWKYESDTETTVEDLMIKYAKSVSCNQVYMIDPKTNLIIKQYNSGAEAEKELNITHGKISEVCNHKYGRKTAGGYKWEWVYELKRRLVGSEFK